MPDDRQVTILFFGQLAEAANNRFSQTSILFDCPPSCKNIGDLRLYLCKKDDTLSQALSRPSTLLSVNQQICDPTQTISSGDEIAFMSPLSGG